MAARGASMSAPHLMPAPEAIQRGAALMYGEPLQGGETGTASQGIRGSSVDAPAVRHVQGGDAVAGRQVQSHNPGVSSDAAGCGGAGPSAGQQGSGWEPGGAPAQGDDIMEDEEPAALMWVAGFSDDESDDDDDDFEGDDAGVIEAETLDSGDDVEDDVLDDDGDGSDGAWVAHPAAEVMRRLAERAAQLGHMLMRVEQLVQLPAPAAPPPLLPVAAAGTSEVAAHLKVLCLSLGHEAQGIHLQSF